MKRKYFNIKIFLNGGGDIVSMKLKIIGFYDKYGLKATRDAFWISKSTIYEWKKRLKESSNNSLEFILNQFKNKYQSKMLWHYTLI